MLQKSLITIIEKTKAKLRRAQHKEKMLEHQIKTLKWKERTHRFCTKGAILESHLSHPESVTDEPVSTILKVLFHRGDNKRLVAQSLFEKQKEDAIRFVGFKGGRFCFCLSDEDYRNTRRSE
jgi:hypothetical protein